ncbi:hypothetical protein [Fimbriiglobus ruber]|uniref:Uncharacterized protein n=1 Tax=Fimbriiglobus ruber TaxID=1908690 RepID=A0A225DHQ1_9BACT|nr:hypothetical protein [Fimbriiglobus ruber]OWK36719.1 hypothetical protein FRUB_09282 [Fimbriiglobus ruber]
MPQSTVEPGEPAPRVSRGGKGASGNGPVGGKHGGDIEFRNRVHEAAAALDAQAKQVGLARWRADLLIKKAADAKGKGPLVELPAELEALRARAEVVAAVMTWRQARVRLDAAQGLLGGE